MRGSLAILTVAVVLLFAGCGTSEAQGVVHVRPYTSHGLRSNLCASVDCGPYAAALRWSIAWDHRTTGYYVYLNGAWDADVAASRWMLGGMDCGTTYTFGVRAHNRSGHASKEYRAHYTTPACRGPKVDYYVSQAPSGKADGSSCANAAAASVLGTPREWRAGKIIGLCGTITSDIVAHGSGTRGKPITLYFEPGATLSQPACVGACLTLNNRSYITVDGGTNGIIQNTANGTGLANQASSTGIQADPCTGCTFENLTIQNIYVHTSTSDTSGGQTFGLYVSGSNLTVKNNTLDNMRGAVYIDENDRPSDTDLQFVGNTIYDVDYGFWLANYNNAGGAGYGPFLIYDNDVHDFGTWDTTSDSFHHDGLMCYSSGSGTADIGRGLYVYDNRFGGSAGQDMTADIFLPGSGDGTPCATSSSNIYIFNNVFDHTDGTGGNGDIAPHVGDVRVWNNTIIQPTNRTGIGLYLNYGGTIDLRNNLFDGGNELVQDRNPGAVTLAPVPDHNFYAHGGPNAFVCNGFYGFPRGFSRWRSCTGGDRHGTAEARPFSLNSDGSLRTGSVAARAGENLYEICTGQPNPGLGALCESIDGTARRSSGAWPVGAY